MLIELTELLLSLFTLSIIFLNWACFELDIDIEGTETDLNACSCAPSVKVWPATLNRDKLTYLILGKEELSFLMLDRDWLEFVFHTSLSCC